MPSSILFTAAVLSIILIYPVLTMIRYWEEEWQRKRVRDMFGTMVSNIGTLNAQSAVTATGTTFWAAADSGRSNSAAKRQQARISAPVH